MNEKLALSASVLRLSVCRQLYVRNVWLSGASWSKSYYWQPTIGSRMRIDWYQNECPWPLFRGRSSKVKSTIAASISPKLLELETSNLVRGFVWGLPSGRTNNFPLKWAWPSVKFSSMKDRDKRGKLFRWVHIDQRTLRVKVNANRRNSVRDN